MESKSREATRPTKEECPEPSEPLDTNRTTENSASNAITSNAIPSDAVTSVRQTTASPPLPLHKTVRAATAGTSGFFKELPAQQQQSYELSELSSRESLNAPHTELDKDKEPKEVRKRPARKTKKEKQARRGKPKRQQTFEKLKIIGTNANGMKSKRDSLNSILATERPQVFMLQETKSGKPNQISIDGYDL